MTIIVANTELWSTVEGIFLFIEHQFTLPLYMPLLTLPVVRNEYQNLRTKDTTESFVVDDKIDTLTVLRHTLKCGCA